MNRYNVVIIGAGAAGMMAAIEAGGHGRKVLLIDHSKKAGEKIRISGGGKCNFTNLEIKPERFISDNPRFALSALSRYTQMDFIQLITSAGIEYHEKTLGQLFCNGSAQQIIDLLLERMQNNGIELWLNTRVDKVSKTSGFHVSTTKGVIETDSLVIASGGKSIPKMGATGLGYQIAEQFGLPIVQTRAGLVPLTFASQELGPIKALAGASVNASVKNQRIGFDEGLLFTHRGLSGPSILQISSYWFQGEEITVDLVQGVDLYTLLHERKQTAGKTALNKVLSEYMPKRVAEFCLMRSGLKGNLADLSNQKLRDLVDSVKSWVVKPVGSEGYRTAEVTLGGVDTTALNAKTMEARDVPGLFFIGEVVDVTGWLGGYNFQWAWSSGWAAGQVA